MRAALVLRPEPGNAATVARLVACGIAVRRCPLFAVAPVPWSPPPPDKHDSLLLTSANAVRHAGGGLGGLAHLPVLAVGDATAAAARAAGLTVALTGAADAAALMEAARAQGWRRALHLAGRERHDLPDVTALSVYASAERPIEEDEIMRWAGHVALLHSPRAARRFAGLVDRAGATRKATAVAALSAVVGEAAGAGWAGIAVAAAPRDPLLVAAAVALIDPSRPAADKRA